MSLILREYQECCLRGRDEIWMKYFHAKFALSWTQEIPEVFFLGEWGSIWMKFSSQIGYARREGFFNIEYFDTLLMPPNPFFHFYHLFRLEVFDDEWTPGMVHILFAPVREWGREFGFLNSLKLRLCAREYVIHISIYVWMSFHAKFSLGWTQKMPGVFSGGEG